MMTLASWHLSVFETIVTSSAFSQHPSRHHPSFVYTLLRLRKEMDSVLSPLLDLTTAARVLCHLPKVTECEASTTISCAYCLLLGFSFVIIHKQLFCRHTARAHYFCGGMRFDNAVKFDTSHPELNMVHISLSEGP